MLELKAEITMLRKDNKKSKKLEEKLTPENQKLKTDNATLKADVKKLKSDSQGSRNDVISALSSNIFFSINDGKDSSWQESHVNPSFRQHLSRNSSIISTVLSNKNS
jgi:hypothetical protein